MKTLCVMVAIAVLAGAIALADSMSGQGVASGNVVLWFSGTRATATFDGTFSLTGQLILGESSVPFSASGWASGAGEGDTATLDVEAWATFAASGSTQSGLNIAVQGGMTLSELAADSGGSSGSATGKFFATVFIDGQRYYVQGEAAGSASGAFVVPADPLSMELAGEGVFDLSGDLALVTARDGGETAGDASPDEPFSSETTVLELLPWDPATWPEALLTQLLDILTSLAEPSTTTGSPSGAD
jgi:hypothetical protein